MLIGAVLVFAASVYGCTQVRDGLDLVDVIPRGTRQHTTVEVQQKYFSFYPIFIITKGKWEADFDCGRFSTFKSSFKSLMR